MSLLTYSGETWGGIRVLIAQKVFPFPTQRPYLAPWQSRKGQWTRAFQNNVAKVYHVRNHIYGENFKLKPCTCIHASGTRTKFQREIFIGMISAKHTFRETSWGADKTLVKHPSGRENTSCIIGPLWEESVARNRWLLWMWNAMCETLGALVCMSRRNIKAPRHWPLWGEFSGDRWIPRTKGR